MGEAPRSWPDHYPETVSRVAAQLAVLRETLPAITDSNVFPLQTQSAVEAAISMLRSYQQACEAAEAERLQLHEANLVDTVRKIAEENVQERVKAAVNAATKQQLAELTEIARRHVRLTSRRRRAKAKKGGKGRG